MSCLLTFSVTDQIAAQQCREIHSFDCATSGMDRYFALHCAALEGKRNTNIIFVIQSTCQFLM